MIESLVLSNFRNFSEREVGFSPKTTVIVGDNGVGKTNLIEAIYMMSTGKSFRAGLQSDVISYNAEVARVEGKFEEEPHRSDVDKESMITLGVVLTHGVVGKDLPAGGQKSTPKKRLLVNGVPRRMRDFVGNFRSVLFSPRDMELVTASPSARRGFLDDVLSQVDYRYRSSLSTFEKALRRRNRILQQVRDEGVEPGQLTFWDRLLVKHGDFIGNRRADFVYFTNKQVSVGENELALEYERNVISEERIEEYKRREIAAGTSLIGPHRDDFKIMISENGRQRRDIAYFGSRGEQRLAVLWLKFSELSFVEQEAGERPTLLLDDIFSELDHDNRDVVMEVVGKQQTIMTTADPHFVEDLEDIDKVVL